MGIGAGFMQKEGRAIFVCQRRKGGEGKNRPKPVQLRKGKRVESRDPNFFLRHRREFRF